jgi:hypothetical protein
MLISDVSFGNFAILNPDVEFSQFLAFLFQFIVQTHHFEAFHLEKQSQLLRFSLLILKYSYVLSQELSLLFTQANSQVESCF